MVSRGRMEPKEDDPSRFLIQATRPKKHDVGKGTHQRTVYEYPTPDGYSLNVGETLNAPGAWSSWPAHCKDPVEAQKRCGQHEEAFLVITPGAGVALLDGWYVDVKKAEGAIPVSNNDVVIMHLGSHPIVRSPGAWV